MTLDGIQRHANVAGAFVWQGKPVYGPVLLVDDVYTTGATMDACAEAVQAEGMTCVDGIVFARALGYPNVPG